MGWEDRTVDAKRSYHEIVSSAKLDFSVKEMAIRKFVNVLVDQFCQNETLAIRVNYTYVTSVTSRRRTHPCENW